MARRKSSSFSAGEQVRMVPSASIRRIARTVEPKGP
jgi:hypothetical protein